MRRADDLDRHRAGGELEGLARAAPAPARRTARRASSSALLDASHSSSASPRSPRASGGDASRRHALLHSATSSDRDAEKRASDQAHHVRRAGAVRDRRIHAKRSATARSSSAEDSRPRVTGMSAIWSSLSTSARLLCVRAMTAMSLSLSVSSRSRASRMSEATTTPNSLRVGAGHAPHGFAGRLLVRAERLVRLEPAVALLDEACREIDDRLRRSVVRHERTRCVVSQISAKRAKARSSEPRKP